MRTLRPSRRKLFLPVFALFAIAGQGRAADRPNTLVLAAQPPGAAPAAAAKPLHVLFLGNSFTARNKLPELVPAMALAGQPAVQMETTAITYGGRTMEHHWNLNSQTWVKLPSLTTTELEQSITDLKDKLAKDPINENLNRSIQHQEGLRSTRTPGRNGTTSSCNRGKTPRAA